MVIGTVLSRVKTLVSAEPFRYEEARDSFSFQLQPSTALHKAFRLEAQKTGEDGYLGMYCAERWELSLWITRRVRGNAVGAYDALLTDVSSLTAAVHRDARAGDYVVYDSVRAELPQPGGDEDFLVARLRAEIDFDRAL